MYGAGHADGSCKILSRILRVLCGCRDHGTDASFHIRGAAAINPAVFNLGSKGVMAPLVTVNDIHSINVPVHQDCLSRTAAMDDAQNASVFVNVHLVKAIVNHGFL